MAERSIPNIPGYHGDDRELKAILDSLRRAIDALTKTDFVTEKDIYCKDLITSENSIYIGSKKPENKLENISKQLYWNKTLIIDDSSGIAVHASRHSDGELDEVNHDDLTGFVADEHIPLAGVTVDIPISFEIYDAEPARGSESNIHGGLLSLAVGQPLDTVPTNLPVSKGTGKIMIVVNAGSDISGTISIAGDSVDRDTGVTGADTEELAVDALTTDGSDTDSNGNTRHSFTGAYITSKWWTGAITISTSNLTLTDVDVYHVSFEQFGDLSGMTLDTFDANIFTTNVNAEFDAYLYSIEVTGDKCNVVRQASLNVGADGETALANKYWRLRKGNIAKALDGSTDGVWVDIHYSNSPAYVEDVTVRVWATKSQALTY